MKAVQQVGKLLIAGVWACIAFVMAIQLYLRFSHEGQSPSFLKLLIIQLLAWSVWLGFTPIIIQLGRRFRLSRATWKSGLVFHLPFSIVLVLFFLLCYVSIFLFINQIEFSADNYRTFYLSFYFQIFQWCWLIYWAVLGISYAVEYYDKFRDRELKAAALEKNLSVAQLQALQMQLQPHFLFNTLHTIAAKVRLDEKQSAVQMLSLLSDLLRKVLQSSQVQLTPLAQELDFLKEYLKLEQIRFENRLEIQFEIEDAASVIEVPSMILQPLIENAMKHGFSRKLDARSLHISAKIMKQHLVLSVYNDGPSLVNQSLEQGGIGLSNIKKRLARTYGNLASFQLSNEAKGVCALIHIPFPYDEAN